MLMPKAFPHGSMLKILQLFHTTSVKFYFLSIFLFIVQSFEYSSERQTKPKFFLYNMQATSTSNPHSTVHFLSISKLNMALPFSHLKVSFLLLHLLLCHLSCFLGSSSDELALLSFKSLITHDPYRGLASWGNHSLHFCQWHGVTCRRHKVTALDLQALDLAGSISPSLGNLTFLQRLYLSENQLSGPIPEELGLLSNLQHLNLSLNLIEGMIPHTLSRCVQLQTICLMNNSFHGEIPSNLSHCSDLQIIDLRNNHFRGIIPSSLGALKHLKQLLLFNNFLKANDESDWAFLATLANCSKLQILSLSINKLGGDFPTFIGNLSSGLQILSLYDNQMTGRIPPSIYRLVNLLELDLHDNLLDGILSQDIGSLFKLKIFDVGNNQISGVVPNSIKNLSSLNMFDLYRNKFSGGIPIALQNLTYLTILRLSRNHFVGFVPPFLGSLLRLQYLILGMNNLSGTIPPSLGNLQSLNYLDLAINNLEGVIPNSMWNLSSLQGLQMQFNNLYGVIAHNIGHVLPNLIHLMLYNNQFYGPIPTSFSNCSSLEHIFLSRNDFTGIVPINFGSMKSFSQLDLSHNRLEARDYIDWAFLESLTNCTNLEYLDLSDNEFSGIFPSSIVNLSLNLNILSLGNNPISGAIPSEIKNLLGLSVLDLGGMSLEGIIPATIGSLHPLVLLYLNYNELYGEIPYTLGNLSKLNKLRLEYNNLSGHIPPTLGLCNLLESINLESNMLIGTIPIEISNIFSLTIGLSLSKNFLSGSLPFNIGNLINIIYFDVSNNKLSGQIPNSIGQCVELQYLHMENNYLEGTIPLSLKTLRDLKELDLSHNQFIGEIPGYLGTFSLQYLNLSFNQLEGEVPTSGIFANASAFSVFRNKQLCGGIPELGLASCFHQLIRRDRSHLVVVITVLSVAFVIILIVVFILWRNKLSKLSPLIWRQINEQHVKVSYANLLKATNGFSTENLIGVGSFSSVYKGNMQHKGNNIVAVKVLNLQQFGASKSFKVECKALRTAKHRNLVKVLTACSSIDHAGNDFKALVFEFMPNGSLEKWLHPQLNDVSSNIASLNLIQRLNIAVDVACALDYLHNQGSMSIIHCDLKPSNVLLDEDMVAHVGDFGLARLLTEATSESSQISTESIALKGTIGYVAPEYGMANQVSTRGDVYSFGILLLEIFTGRRPTDQISIESHNLNQFVQMALPEQVMSIVDPKMFSEEDEELGNLIDHHINHINIHEKECIVSVLNVGLLCSKESPLERMQIGDASKQLRVVKSIFNKAQHS